MNIKNLLTLAIAFSCGLWAMNFQSVQAGCGYEADCGDEIKCENIGSSDSYAFWVISPDSADEPEECGNSTEYLTSGYCGFSLTFEEANCKGDIIQYNVGTATTPVECTI